MAEFNITAERITSLRSSRASLCALGAICQERKSWRAGQEGPHQQKVVLTNQRIS